MHLFKNKYRIESTRLRGWDYRSAGFYFVTICTEGRRCFFGEVRDGEVTLSEAGAIVAEEWQRAPQVRPHVGLDAWVVMPNHIHGIIVIHPVETPRRGVSTGATLPSGSLGAIIGQFKSICTKRIWAAGHRSFAWQSRFYDHIIRDDASLQAIRNYIVNNAAKWETDRNHPEKVWF